MNAATLELRVAEIAATRRRSRTARFATYLLVLVIVAWSVEAIVVKDTDWSRILTGSLLTTLTRFLEIGRASCRERVFAVV